MRDETRVIVLAAQWKRKLLHESAEARGDELEAFEVTQFVLVTREHGRIIEQKPEVQHTWAAGQSNRHYTIIKRGV